MVNPAHLAREHQDEFVECSCAKDQRESLISKLKSYGATNAEEGVYYNNNNDAAMTKFTISLSCICSETCQSC